ncbi:MAG: hypothetical protein Q7U16_12340 [Agitococcus sp.]|nr:hypothetical protein [Agitococcus sp.]
MSIAALFSEETRQRAEQEQREAFRLYQLTDPWLSRELLKLTRQAQRISPQYKVDQPRTYNSVLIYGIVPEIARRLSPVKLTTDEIDWTLRGLSHYDLRVRAGHCLQNIAESTLPGWIMLAREACNGNPILYALDRLCPGNPLDADDVLTRRIAEVSRFREKAYDGVWSPRICR